MLKVLIIFHHMLDLNCSTNYKHKMVKYWLKTKTPRPYCEISTPARLVFNSQCGLLWIGHWLSFNCISTLKAASSLFPTISHSLYCLKWLKSIVTESLPRHQSSHKITRAYYYNSHDCILFFTSHCCNQGKVPDNPSVLLLERKHWKSWSCTGKAIIVLAVITVSVRYLTWLQLALRADGRASEMMGSRTGLDSGLDWNLDSSVYFNMHYIFQCTSKTCFAGCMKHSNRMFRNLMLSSPQSTDQSSPGNSTPQSWWQGSIAWCRQCLGFPWSGYATA